MRGHRRARGTALVVALVLGLCGCASPPGPASPPPITDSVPTATPVLSPPVTPPALPTPARSVAPATPFPSPTPPVLPASVVASNITPHPVKAIAAGWGICAIRDDGTLACWGREAGSVPTGKFVSVSAGSDGMCAIRTSGKLVCWGDDGSRRPVPPGAFTAVGFGESDGAKCAIRRDATLACWSDFTDSGRAAREVRMKAVPAGTFTMVSAVGSGWCALRTDATLACWAGQSDTPAPEASDGTFRSVSGPCTIRTGGELECFGSDEWLVPGPPDSGSFVAVSAIWWFGRGCALRTDGTLACWGGEGYDEESDNDLPMRAPPGTFTSVTVGADLACATRTDGRAVCWGSDDEAARPAPTVKLDLPGWVPGRRIALRWDALPAFAPITSYDVERLTERDEDGQPSGWTAWREGTTTRRATFRGAPGETYCWRARARDADGIVSSWTYQSCTTLPEDDAVFARSAGWSTVHGGRYYLGRASLATRRGSKLTVDVETGSLLILATTCPICGTIRVYVDGESDEEISLSSSTTRHRSMVWMSDNGQDGFYGRDGESSSTITIEVVTKGRPVIIDGIVIGVCTDCS